MLSNEQIIDHIDSVIGKIPVVSNNLIMKDHIGTLRMRLNISRMSYSIDTGLYAVGNPTKTSPVLVSANYKMSFDFLRKELHNIDAWILVIDTKAINVWCAAGKGTFGTDELIKQVKDTKLEKLVNHRELIVPQLGAPGVSAHTVKKQTSFKVVYGPVRAVDIPAFLETSRKATKEMRKVNFKISDRIALVPLEFVQGFKYVFISMLIFSILSGLSSTGYSIRNLLTSGLISIFCIAMSYIAGVVLTPALLPYIPGRAFALKGFILNTILFVFLFELLPMLSNLHNLEKIAWFFIMSAISSFFSMNFTGASTYTSLSGVKKEMRYAVPLQIIALVLGFILWVIKRFI